MNTQEEYVTIDKDIVGGTPVFKGTRVTVKTLFDYLEESSLEEFLLAILPFPGTRPKLLLNWQPKNFLLRLLHEDTSR